MPMVALPGGPTLRYREWGRPDGAVVLLLHGSGSDGDTWRHVAPVLGEHFRVVAPDLRGHADSEWPVDYSLELMRDDIVGLLEALGVLGAIVVGHSLGALIGFLLAGTRPDLVRMLVLEEMPPPDAAVPPRPLPMHPDPAAYTDWRAVIAVRRWRNVAHPDWWRLANEISVPTLLLAGRRSDLDHARMRELASAVPHARYVETDLGHDLHTEQPSVFLRAVEPFLSRYAK
jgi:pimeloyl-ACP methyl ester carboxylesterase